MKLPLPPTSIRLNLGYDILKWGRYFNRTLYIYIYICVCVCVWECFINIYIFANLVFDLSKSSNESIDFGMN